MRQFCRDVPLLASFDRHDKLKHIGHFLLEPTLFAETWLTISSYRRVDCDIPDPTNDQGGRNNAETISFQFSIVGWLLY